MPSIHAEHMGCTKFIKTHNIKRTQKIDVMVLRVSKNGENLGNSRPCKECLMRLSKSMVNINNVYYSQDNSNICVEKFSHMVRSNQSKQSSGTRRAKTTWTNTSNSDA